MKVKYSIIIPVKEINDYIRETIPYILSLNLQNWELVIIPNDNAKSEWMDARIRIIESGRVGPADKRDMGAGIATGEFLVFLDDDSYPKDNLLDVAEKYFADSGVAAIGGPAVTPPQDAFWQRVSGAVFLSNVSGGAPERYIPLGEVREVDDWPSVNFIIRRSDFLSVGGFNSKFWPGEDTKLCLDIIKKTGKKILYIPELIVWHHRRPGLLKHLKQIGAYGLHRGFFVKKFPETSFRFKYFLPSFFLLFIVFSLFTVFMPVWLKLLIIGGWIVYALALFKAFFDIMKYEKPLVSLCGIYYTCFTHAIYGFRFLQGLLFTRMLISKLR